MGWLPHWVSRPESYKPEALTLRRPYRGLDPEVSPPRFLTWDALLGFVSLVKGSRFKCTNSRSSLMGREGVLSLRFSAEEAYREELLWAFPVEGLVRVRGSWTS